MKTIIPSFQVAITIRNSGWLENLEISRFLCLLLILERKFFWYVDKYIIQISTDNKSSFNDCGQVSCTWSKEELTDKCLQDINFVTKICSLEIYRSFSCIIFFFSNISFSSLRISMSAHERMHNFFFGAILTDSTKNLSLHSSNTKVKYNLCSNRVNNINCYLSIFLSSIG